MYNKQIIHVSIRTPALTYFGLFFVLVRRSSLDGGQFQSEVLRILGKSNAEDTDTDTTSLNWKFTHLYKDPINLQV